MFLPRQSLQKAVAALPAERWIRAEACREQQDLVAVEATTKFARAPSRPPRHSAAFHGIVARRRYTLFLRSPFEFA